MKKIEWIIILMLLLCFPSAYADIRITEIMTNNVSTIVSDKYNYDGYVEFYNDGGDVDLRGWTVTNIEKDKVEWSVRLDSTHILPSGYSLLFFGKSETSSLSASKIQSNFAGRVGKKLTTDEGLISFEKDGRQIFFTYPSQRPHLSYCEGGYMMPTPGLANDGLVTSLSNRVETPSFKAADPGFYETGVSVELACGTDSAIVYYTLNGDVPTPENGEVYQNPILIEKTTVLRARAYKEGMLYSEILTGSYIFPDKFYNACEGLGDRLPIVSISGNYEDIFGDMLGIYVEGKNGIEISCTPVANYNQDWMRSANFEYILNGKVVDCQEVEIGVYGGCTRIHVAKSLKIKANKRSGKNRMDYKSFFSNRSYTKYKSLALRNGGNGYSYVQPRWRDMFIQSLADGMNIDRQAAQPVSFYLNGTFYGMMILTERTDEDFVFHNYGLDDDEIDLLNANFSGYELEKGTRDAYDKMIDYVSNSYADDDFYEKLDTHMDIDEYMNYQILEQFVGNTDWVTHNTKVWRKHDGGRFRWIVYDTDFGLSKATSLDTCMLDFTTKYLRTNVKAMLVLMQSCMKNEDFRWRFLDQYIECMDSVFTDQRIDKKIDSLWSMTERDMCATIKNSGLLDCPGSLDVYDQEIEKMRVFAKERKAHVVDQLKKEYGLGDDTVVIKVRSVFPDDETPKFSYLVNKRLHDDVKYNSWRYVNERVKVEPIVPYGYRIQKWALNNVTVRNDDGSRYTKGYLTRMADSTELKMTIYFEHDPDCPSPVNLCLNEVCALNNSTLDENGEASDWIELYNGGDKDIDLAGMVVENVTKVARCTIPSGSDESVVPAHGYKLLWADKKPELGPLHLNFKLGVSASETIVLRASYLGKDLELSTISYNPHNADESYGRDTDGASSVMLFAQCLDDEGNELMTSTPLSANGSVVCPNSVTGDDLIANHNAVDVYTLGKELYVRNAKGSDVRVYTLKGEMVVNERSNSDSFVIDLPSDEAYLVKVGKKCWKVRGKR